MIAPCVRLIHRYLFIYCADLTGRILEVHSSPGLRPGLLCDALTGLAGPPGALCLFDFLSLSLLVSFAWRQDNG